MVPDEVVGSLMGAGWGLDVGAVERPTAGTMNEVVIVTTGDGGRVVLRGHHRRDRSRVELEHEVMAFARARGVPVPEAIPTPGGAAIVERDGGFWSLFDHARGVQVPRDQLTDRHAAAMGRALARAHAALQGFPHDRVPRADRHIDSDVDRTLQGIERLLAHLSGLDAPGEHEAWATERLRSRAAWLRRNPWPVDVDATVAGDQVVHGDYQDSNVFFDDGEVSAIVDWDKAEIRSTGEEVVRAMHLSFRLDPALCRAFLDAYRAVSPLAGDHLDRAAAVYERRRACDLWLYEAIYLRGDDRPRRFLVPGPFVPLRDQWAPLRAAIVGDRSRRRGRTTTVLGTGSGAGAPDPEPRTKGGR